MEQLSRYNFWIIAINSTASFILSYLIIFYINQMMFVITAGMYDYPITVDYATIYFHLEPSEWIHDAVFLIFSAGYVATFIVGLLSLLAFYNLLVDPMPVKILFFWLFIHSSTYFFGGLLLGNLLVQGIGHVFNWMYLKDTAKLLLSLVGFFGLLTVSLMSFKMIATSSNSYFSRYTERLAPFFLTAQVFVPYTIGSLLIWAYFAPKAMFQEKYGWIVLGIMLLIFFMRSRFTEDLMFDEDDHRKVRPMRGLVIFSLLFYLGSRLIMHFGIYFDWR
ncbi:MAG: hypothetical protein ACOYN5_04230 [Bacteroidales bacterium]